ncbi:membrane protein of unknown function [Nitrosotalea devaniterrae]|uniref:Uncharacterized protein n=1 Tax=Nitrosotalea devaniterrae TaxID=1078905 RepID=A0A128A658_9ARCH|nr:membrane protein of unknown function [Candidatus Nitrosotalea devanaterra]
MNKEKIKKILKSKITWFAVGISIPTAIAQGNQSLWFLGIPFAMTMLALIPAAISIECSPGFTQRFATLHKWRHQDHGSYTYATIEAKTPSVLKFSIRTTLYSFAIICNILTWTGMLDALSENANRVVIIMMLTSVPSLFAASIINVATYLLTKSGLMFENKEDSSRINLGREMSSNLEWAISPFIFTSLIYPLVTKPQIMLYILLAMLILFAFCFYTAIISYYLLKKFQLDRLMVNVKRRLSGKFPILDS